MKKRVDAARGPLRCIWGIKCTLRTRVGVQMDSIGGRRVSRRGEDKMKEGVKEENGVVAVDETERDGWLGGATDR